MSPDDWEARNERDARVAHIVVSELFRTMTDTHPDPMSSPVLRSLHRVLDELEHNPLTG